VKEWGRILKALPECGLKDEIMENCMTAIANLPERFQRAFGMAGRAEAGQENCPVIKDSGAAEDASATAIADSSGERCESNPAAGPEPPLAAAAKTLLEEWRGHNQDGSAIAKDPEKLLANLLGIVKSYSELTPESLVDAGRRYLASERESYVAPQDFFGHGDHAGEPLWLEYVLAA
jgi:hypothetical protein